MGNECIRESAGKGNMENVLRKNEHSMSTKKLNLNGVSTMEFDNSPSKNHADSFLDSYKKSGVTVKKNLNIDQTSCSPISDSKVGFQSVLHKTFKGDRGGPAEDADLLAELRAISSKSTGYSVDCKENEQEKGN